MNDDPLGTDKPVSIVVGNRSPVARAIRTELEAHGHEVSVIDGAALDSREAVEDAFDIATADRRCDVVVHADVPPAACRPGLLTDLDLDGWDDGCESLIRSTLLVFRAAHRRLTEGGSIVLVNPSIALAGAAGLAAWSAAAESQRIMAKVAARRWGARGITVNVVAVQPAMLCDDPDPALSALVRVKAAPALGADASTPDAVAKLVCMVTGADARFLTGATLVADGGLLMVP